jgi:hypothetical protein
MRLSCQPYSLAVLYLHNDASIYNEYKAFGGMRIGSENQNTLRKPTPVQP